MAKVNGFTFFASYYDAISFLPEQDRGRMIIAICEYVFNGKEPNFENDVLNGFWKLMLPSLSKSVLRSVSGKQSENKPKAKRKQNESKTETNESKTETNESKTETNESKTETNASYKDKNKDKNKEEERGDIIPPKPPKGEHEKEKEEKPLWKTDKSVYDAMVDEAKQQVLNDTSFRKRKEELHANIDFEKTVENCSDFWKSDDGWSRCKKRRSKNIDLVATIKNGFDKAKIYKPYRSSNAPIEYERKEGKWDSSIRYLKEHGLMD